MATRAFSGRLGRAIKSRYVDAASAEGSPLPAAYPVQRGLTQTMRQAANSRNNIDAMQAWAGQSARLAKAMPAAAIIEELWDETQTLLG